MTFEKILWSQPPGAERAPAGARVVVVGGGIAGLAAATTLSERGVQVTLLEQAATLGGRAGSWPDRLADGTPFQMERGFHAFFRQYYNLRRLLARVDPELAVLQPTTDYPLHGPGAAVESFAGLPRTPPWNLMQLVLRSPSLRLRDLFGINGPEATAMLAYHPEHTYARYDGRSAAEYLDSLRFPDEARRMLFDVFAHSFFNPEERFSAAELIMMFHYYFLGNPEGIVFDVARRPFGPALWEPLARYLEARGVRIATDTAATRVSPAGEGFAVSDAHGATHVADGVVLALTVPALQRLLSDSPALGEAGWRADVAAQEVTAPFAVWRLWLDTPVEAHRAPFVGTTGRGWVDNISLYHALEDESRAWAERTGGAVVELHAYALPEGASEAAVKADMWAQLLDLYPETRGAKILESRYLHHQDCPAFPPGGHARRPGVRTPTPGLTLAGDFVRMPFPTALMERATASGFMAANVLLERWGVAGEALWSVPQVGLLARRRRGEASAA
jgi:isorenieratene synthase